MVSDDSVGLSSHPSGLLTRGSAATPRRSFWSGRPSDRKPEQGGGRSGCGLVTPAAAALPSLLRPWASAGGGKAHDGDHHPLPEDEERVRAVGGPLLQHRPQPGNGDPKGSNASPALTNKDGCDTWRDGGRLPPLPASATPAACRARAALPRTGRASPRPTRTALFSSRRRSSPLTLLGSRRCSVHGHVRSQRCTSGSVAERRTRTS